MFADLPQTRQAPAGRLGLFERFLEGLAPPLRLLDVGCGSGHFLELARARGIDAFGVEPAPALAAAARARSGSAVAEGALSELPPGPAVDLVTLWNVLDQVTDPPRELRACHARLAAGGTLFARVPNGAVHRPLMAALALAGPLAARLGLTGLTPFHPWILQPRDLARLLRQAGFIEVAIEPSPPTGGAWRRLPYLLCRAAAALSGGRWLLSSSIAARARKPR